MADTVPLYARQPIFNRRRDVVAYELLFRGGGGNQAVFPDGNMATAQVLLKVFGENDIHDVIGEHKAFVNYTRTLICTPPPLPSRQLVVEVLEDIRADDEVLAGLKRLREAGYQIALDDFLVTPDTLAMVKYADYIKVDVLALSTAELHKIATRLRPLGKTLLAEKVETHEMMSLCEQLGFELFQGYFLCRPEIIKGVAVSEGKQAVLRLIAVVNDPDVEMQEIITTIATDPSLSYKMLKLVNSSAIGLSRKIESLGQAVTLLGLRAIRNWATFLLMANASDKPQELCVISMCRAKFCEQLGIKAGGRALGDACFTVGLLSNLDAFLDLPMEKLLEKLKLSDEISAALLERHGTMGDILSLVSHYERGNWQEVNWTLLADMGVEAADINQCYSHSVAWASESVSSQR